MDDIEIRMACSAGDLAAVTTALGEVGISVEGGGMFRAGDHGVAHLLVADGPRASRALRAVGIDVAAVRRPVTVRLDQERPGELGALTKVMADGGIKIDAVYSDHDHRLILLVDDAAEAARLRDEWRPDAATTSSDAPVELP